MPVNSGAQRMPLERRAFARRDVDYKAIVRFSDGNGIACRVKNISPMGALIEMPDERPLPQTFRLAIPDEMFSADCDRRHQTGNRTGVLFLSSRAEALARFG